MTRPALAGVHHVKIPVTDLARSVDWYARVFGFAPAMEFADADGVVRGVVGEVPGLDGTMLGLRVNPRAAEGCRDFDPVGLAIQDRDACQAWADHLDGLGVEHSPVIEASIGWLLVFADPDGLQLHLYTWAEHGLDHSDRPGYGRRVTAAS
jgi:catechol 2,3-dioxygenase-like lactoylglutathione lyase family enzyme